MELYLLRHADAGDPGAWHGDDDDRPLSDKGIRQAERLAVHLLRIAFEPGAIVSSPRARARQTADIVAAALEADVRLDDRLARPLDLESVGGIVADAGAPERVVLVGHDPDFSELLELLAGATALPMKKGALARLDLGAELVPGGGTLRWLIPPDALPRD
jgi:phosphohistidine phosphatase